MKIVVHHKILTKFLSERFYKHFDLKSNIQFFGLPVSFHVQHFTHFCWPSTKYLLLSSPAFLFLIDLLVFSQYF